MRMLLVMCVCVCVCVCACGCVHACVCVTSIPCMCMLLVMCVCVCAWVRACMRVCYLHSLYMHVACDVCACVHVIRASLCSLSLLCHLLVSSLLWLKDCEIENKQLRETLKEYNSEFAQVKNQGMYASWKS